MNPEEIKELLSNHKKWLEEDIDGKHANLIGADLRSANMNRSNLRYANLIGADLRDSNLRYADLRDSDLRYANLSGADLRDSDLRDSDLRCANLIGADLRGANLIGAKLDEVAISRLSIVPERGDFTGFKKTREGVVELRIPAHAKRSNSTGRKCRASEAVVVSLPEGCTEAHSIHDSSFMYRQGETVKPTTAFCEDRWQECASGIHFYITRAEAEAHEQ